MTDFADIPEEQLPEAAPITTPQTVNGLEPGMKAMPVMVYTNTRIAWGNVHINENLRVSLVLQSTTVPDYISIYKAKILNLDIAGKAEPKTFSEMHIPTQEVVGFHLMPSHTEPLDYDENEPNRKMEPILAQVGKFDFYGHARISTQTSIKNYVEVTRAEFLTIYDLEIKRASNPNQQAMKVPSAQIRRTAAIFTLRN